MRLNLNYDELAEYVARNFSARIGLEYVSDRTVKVSYSRKVLIKTITVSIALTVERVEEEAVTVSYDGGFAIDHLVKGALAFAASHLPELMTGISDVGDKSLRIDLAAMPKLKSVTDAIALRDISFDPAGITVEASLR